MQSNQKYLLILLLIVAQTTLAQKKDENIGTEVVNVVKPYTATISDAFKVKETPSLDDEDNSKKEDIQYNIFSFPVASTFTPAKGKAAGVDKAKKEKLFSNYATLGFGNYGTIIGELFVTEQLNRNEYVGGMLRHHSSQGGIEEALLDDKFYKTSLDLTYGNQNKDMSWNADLGYQHQIFNWYGTPDYLIGSLSQEDRDLFLNGIDPQQTYHNFYVGGKLGKEDSFFKGASIKYNRFWDAYNSVENRLILKPTFEFAINDFQINTKMIVDNVSGSFERSYFDSNKIDYGFTNVGIHPSFVYNQDDLSMNIGASFFYSIASEGDNNLFVYPQITAAYKVVGDLMIFYAGAEGSLQQNSYRDFTNINPFLSPTQFMIPTDRQYDIFAGLKGKLAGNISYNVRGSYTNEKAKALFKYNSLESFTSMDPSNKAYGNGNSFGVVYDDVKTIAFSGELKADFSKNVSFGINATLNSYTTDFEQEAWNLPAVTVGSNLNVTFTEKWFGGVEAFFVGQRYDEFLTIANDPAFFDRNKATLDSYFDLNTNIGYRHNERLTGFLRLNNILNQSYEKWFNFPAQQFQVVLGANYKFDF